MIKVIIINFGTILISSLAFAQAGTIFVSSTPSGCYCNLSNAAGFMQVYVVHGNFVEATGCQFSVQVYGTPLTYVGESSVFDTFGSAPFGVAVAYGSCVTTGVHVMTITYMGTSAPCDWISVEADPTTIPPGIHVADCATPTPNLLTISHGGMSTINNDGSCPCDLCGGCNHCGVPAENTTWGQVKALYR
jgi:hypothetical protein